MIKRENDPFKETTVIDNIPADMWRNRSVMICVNCMWFVIKSKTSDCGGIVVNGLGRCRRHSPSMSGYPAVFSSDWCGDHKLDEKRTGYHVKTIPSKKEV